MINLTARHLVLAMALAGVAGITASCESDVDRQMRQEREALEESGELEELEKQLETQNPDPYDPKNAGTVNRSLLKQN